MAKKSLANLYDQRSFLRNTGLRNNYLGSSRLPSLDTSKGQYIQVPVECDNRMDLFSYQQYGSSRLWWLIAIANADVIKDPIWDFRAGLYVFVPENSDLLEKLAEVN
jgi:hypothetical protein